MDELNGQEGKKEFSLFCVTGYLCCDVGHGER